MTVSERIMKAIKDRGFSYVELSDKTGVPKSALCRYANGQTDNIPIDRIEAIAKATGVSSAWIIGWEDKITVEMTSEEKRVFDLMLSLDEDEKKQLRDYVDFLISRRK